MHMRDLSIRVAKKTYRLLKRSAFLNPECEINRQIANDIIYDHLTRSDPCMISRFGTTELNCINNYLAIIDPAPLPEKIVRYIVGNTHTPWWNEDHFRMMSLYSGIFPPSSDTSARFAQRYLQDIPEIDVLGSFQYYEKYMPLTGGVKRVQLETLYPFFVDRPWTRALTGKKVLVVHPFDHSIRTQYEQRRLLFDNPEVLPDYTLITFRAVQSVAGTEVPFKDWFEALKYMEDRIAAIDFDVCILGCGAYGLPLAAHIKRLGKKAVHIGGGTQLLFGIKGKRWTEQYKRTFEYRPGEIINTNYVDIFNSHWIFPDTSERPKNSSEVENACYW
jgi:hypothetical protein